MNSSTSFDQEVKSLRVESNEPELKRPFIEASEPDQVLFLDDLSAPDFAPRAEPDQVLFLDDLTAQDFAPRAEPDQVLFLDDLTAQDFAPPLAETGEQEPLALAKEAGEPGGEPSSVETTDESADRRVDDWLKLLRARQFSYETSPWLYAEKPEPAISEPAPSPAVVAPTPVETPAVAETPAVVEEEVEEGGEEEVEEEGEEEVAGFDLAGAFDQLGQEVRRLGRELFKTNRATERNQEVFEESLGELRQVNAAVAQASEQSAEALNAVKFDAKASLCRELLRMADTMRASLAAADELIAQLRAKAGQGVQGFAFRFAATNLLQTYLAEAVASLSQWREGQMLLLERLRAILQTAGVRGIESVGRAFDPALHRAVSVAHSNDVAPGTIVGEELTGYTLDGRILRYAEVIVAKNE
jgi:molecular chaperone GrpE